ncbi:MAG TPA: cyclic nucleotide-binding domain-containing protein [Micavibrio sp.]|nr:cyclic nucleotide-binding domain-containing protein [Micavibrio sp.]HIL29697.1 cyclic nucleotide-binding domain-containing protein [Micavibrio sp.]
MSASTGGNNTIHERRAAPKGSVIMRQGEKGVCAFLIQSGKVRIFAEHNGLRTDLADLSAGEIFGEMALVSEMPRTASVEALEDTNLILITRDVLNGKLAKSDPTVRALVPMLIKRIVQTNDDRMKKADNIATFKEMVSRTYKNIHGQHPAVKKKTMDNMVRPQLEAFLDALTEFEKMNSD